MALKASLLFALACFLLLTAVVTSTEEENLGEAKPPAHAPAKAPCEGPSKPPLAHYPPPPIEPSPVQRGCVPLCEERCKTYRRKRPCMKVCTACCRQSKCVPPPGSTGKCENWDYVILHGQKFQCP